MPYSVGNPASFHAWVPPSRIETFEKPISFKSFPAKAPNSPVSQVVMMGAGTVFEFRFAIIWGKFIIRLVGQRAVRYVHCPWNDSRGRNICRIAWINYQSPRLLLYPLLSFCWANYWYFGHRLAHRLSKCLYNNSILRPHYRFCNRLYREYPFVSIASNYLYLPGEMIMIFNPY